MSALRWWRAVPTLLGRLRWRLMVAIAAASLLPMLLMATIGVQVILRSLERSQVRAVQTQLDVAQHLLLRAVERLGVESGRLATQLAGTFGGDGAANVSATLAGMRDELPRALIELFDADGRLIHRELTSDDPQRFASLQRAAPSRPTGASPWRRTISILRFDGLLLANASAPLVDRNFRLVGTVSISVPLDGAFAASMKASLGTDVLLAASPLQGAALPPPPVFSTFFNKDERPDASVAPPPELLAATVKGGRVAATRQIGGHPYTVGWRVVVDEHGSHVGALGVAVDRQPLAEAQALAFRSLALGSGVVLVVAVLLALLISRRFERPIVRLHDGALAVSRGNLDVAIEQGGDDEIGDLGRAFANMTAVLRENRYKLEARMRELQALHETGRAVNAAIDLAVVSREFIAGAAKALDARGCSLWLVPSSTAEPGSARPELALSEGPADDLAQVSRLNLVSEVAAARVPRRAVATARGRHPSDAVALRPVAMASQIQVLAVPLELKGELLGVVVASAPPGRSFLDSDISLLATLASQAASSLQNARLYQQVVEATYDLERKVELRTAELVAANRELEAAMANLHQTQLQLVHSERMAGLGLLVAGVAHEINSPSAAIGGAAATLTEVVSQLGSSAAGLLSEQVSYVQRVALFAWLDTTARALGDAPLPSGVAARRAAQQLVEHHQAYLGKLGLDPNELARLGIDAATVERAAQLAGDSVQVARATLQTLIDYTRALRATRIIRQAIARVSRLVAALKTYSHSDTKQESSRVELQGGLESTLVLFDFALRGIAVERELPDEPVAVLGHADELNQVWTNLLQNAIHALAGKGTLRVSLRVVEGDAVVAIADDGPGIPPEVIERIYEPFFTTKPKGQGTGLGLGIVKQIVERHGGRIRCQSRPGETIFEVVLPLARRAGTATGAPKEA